MIHGRADRPGTVYSLGSILVDIAVDVPALPERGGDVLAGATRTLVGGGFNLAAAVARQDVRCVYAGSHGTGHYGDLVRESLAAEGIATAGRQRGGDTGFCITMIEPDGERTFVTVPGVETRLDPADLAAVRPGRADLVAVSGYDLLYPGSGAVLAAWITALPEHVRVALDPGPLVLDIPPDRLGGVLERLWLITMNQREARLLSGSGTTGSDASGPDLITEFCHRTGLSAAATVVVREGSSGCLATGGSLAERVISVPAPAVDAVDTTGAGDTHTGVLLAELARGSVLDDALLLANRAAAISVTRVGSATCPRRCELLSS